VLHAPALESAFSDAGVLCCFLLLGVFVFYSDRLLRACINPVFSCNSDCVTDSLCK
jgi:hypothetical protein